MILPVYLAKKFLKAFIISSGVSYSIFFIFSLIGNLGEKLSFKSIFILSAFNSIQIFTYIPSYLFISSLCLFIIHLKSKNELIIIKEYIELKNLFLIIFPILALFIFIEINKENLSDNIKKIKSNLINSNNLVKNKVFISSEGNKKKYTIFSGYDEDNKTIKQYLSFVSLDQKVYKGEISTNLFLNGTDLLSNKSTIYEDNNFRHENINKKLFENFIGYWSTNSRAITKNKTNSKNAGYNIIQTILL